MIINSDDMKDRDLIVICPTRERPQKLERMYDSYIKTKSGKTELILCVDVDDPTEYNYGCTISVEPHKNNTQIINDIFYKFPDYKYYMVINDDVVFHTYGWDYKMMGYGINFANDATNRRFPFFSIIDGDIPRALGWLQMPDLEYLYGDTCWNHIAKCLKIDNYFEDILIEHRHFLFGHNSDKIYEKTNSKEQTEKDRLAFTNWLVNKSNFDIRKLEKVYAQKEKDS